MGLAGFIRRNLDSLTVEWEQYASTLPAARGLDEEALRDSSRELLAAIAAEVASVTNPQPDERPDIQRLGSAPEVTACAHRHAVARLAQGFTLDQMASEYQALRSNVMRRWTREDPLRPTSVEEVVRFNAALDQGWVEAMVWYGQRVETARELFLAVLSHDLRTPLGTVMMSAEMLVHDQSLNSRAASLAARIVKSGDRISRMVEDLLDFTRSRLGVRLPITVSRCELGQLVRQTIEELALAHADADLREECEEDLWGEWDPSRLCQMLSNLVGNALQHGDAGKPVEVVAAHVGDDVVISIHNEGAPIPAEAISQVFEPLMRGNAQEGERRGRQQSLGLGLYIARQIARAHGGDIEAASSAEAGTTFTIRLPKSARVEESCVLERLAEG